MTVVPLDEDGRLIFPTPPSADRATYSTLLQKSGWSACDTTPQEESAFEHWVLLANDPMISDEQVFEAGRALADQRRRRQMKARVSRSHDVQWRPSDPGRDREIAGRHADLLRAEQLAHAPELTPATQTQTHLVSPLGE